MCERSIIWLPLFLQVCVFSTLQSLWLLWKVFIPDLGFGSSLVLFQVQVTRTLQLCFAMFCFYLLCLMALMFCLCYILLILFCVILFYLYFIRVDFQLSLNFQCVELTFVSFCHPAAWMVRFTFAVPISAQKVTVKFWYLSYFLTVLYATFAVIHLNLSVGMSVCLNEWFLRLFPVVCSLKYSALLMWTLLWG